MARHKNQLAHRSAGPQPQPPLIAAGIFRSQHFSGPLPPPEALAKYNEALPGSAERIVAMAERQSQHRQELEKMVITSNTTAQRRGALYGFIVSMTVVLGGMYLLYLGKSTAGLVAIISPLAGLAGVFVYGKRAQSKQLEQKARDLLPAR